MKISDRARVFFNYPEEDVIICNLEVINFESANKPYMFSTTVRRHFKDRPNRRLGRLIAFRNTVRQIPSKDLRTEIWEGFSNNIAFPKKK